MLLFCLSTPKKHSRSPSPDSRLPLREERLKEAMREALENERTAKSALFKREQAEAESERLREQYDVLVGQFEAIKSQVELEKLEAQGTVTRYERELEDVHGKLNAKDEYAGLLCGVKKDMDVELNSRSGKRRGGQGIEEGVWCAQPQIALWRRKGQVEAVGVEEEAVGGPVPGVGGVPDHGVGNVRRVHPV
jgi:hypothetical protein